MLDKQTEKKKKIFFWNAMPLTCVLPNLIEITSNDFLFLTHAFRLCMRWSSLRRTDQCSCRSRVWCRQRLFPPWNLYRPLVHMPRQICHLPAGSAVHWEWRPSLDLYCSTEHWLRRPKLTLISERWYGMFRELIRGLSIRSTSYQSKHFWNWFFIILIYWSTCGVKLLCKAFTLLNHLLVADDCTTDKKILCSATAHSLTFIQRWKKPWLPVYFFCRVELLLPLPHVLFVAAITHGVCVCVYGICGLRKNRNNNYSIYSTKPVIHIKLAWSLFVE